MSNHLAIATVTETLRHKLEQVVQKDFPQQFPNPDVQAGPPKEASGNGSAGIRILLYQVSPNGAFRNADLPARRPDATVAQRPQAAMDLYYLLTFFGKENLLEPQLLLGSVARYLHSRPELTRGMIEDAIDDIGPLADSDLAYQVEKVKFTPVPFSLEELSKLWSVFSPTRYLLSAVYQASVVLIEAEETRQRALPVRARNLYVTPFRQPVIEVVTSEPGPQPFGLVWADDPILVGQTLMISGRQLRGDVTRLLIAGVEVEPASVSDTQITLPLSSPPIPDGSLRSGVLGLQVVHKIMMDTKPESQELHRGFESNLAAFVLRPSFTSQDVQVVDITIDGTQLKQVVVTLAPAVGRKQRVVLLLNELDPPADRAPHAYRFDAPKDNGIADRDVDETLAVPFTISDSEGNCLVEFATYLVRVQVDGAESPLAVDAGRYTEPEVTVQ